MILSEPLEISVAMSQQVQTSSREWRGKDAIADARERPLPGSSGLLLWLLTDILRGLDGRRLTDITKTASNS